MKMSDASRRRLMRQVATVSSKELPTFITLLYPDEFPTDPREMKGDLDAWLKRLSRQHPNASAFWKLEIKERQSGKNAGKVAPHFHLMAWGLPWKWEDKRSRQLHMEYQVQKQLEVRRGKRLWKMEVFEGQHRVQYTEHLCDHKPDEILKVYRRQYERKGKACERVETWIQDGVDHVQAIVDYHKSETMAPIELREWVALTWAEVVGSDDPRHLLAGTGCDPVRSFEGVMSYVSKYICKADSEAAGKLGRWWGIHNRKGLPWAEAVPVQLSAKQATRLMRVARRYVQGHCSKFARKIRWRPRAGMTIFAKSSWWLERLPCITGG
jgi:hypothetical protein